VPTSELGLRERKKAKTRSEIRAQALRLFQEQGYHETSIEQIAAAAEVSPSTFFRYFPTKERVVLSDDLDTVLLAAFVAQPPDLPVLSALGRAIEAGKAELDCDNEAERRHLIATIPELQVAKLNDLERVVSLLVGAVAGRLGGQADAFEIRVLTGALSGAIRAAATGPARQPGGFRRAINFLETGFPLARG
jgi:AcrR family transcriptional regulator